MNRTESSPAPGQLDRSVLDAMSTALLTFDRDYRLLEVNGAAESMLHLSRRQSQGQPIDRVLRIPPGDLEPLLRALQDGDEGAGHEDGRAVTQRNLQLLVNGGRSISVDCTITRLSSELELGIDTGASHERGLLVELVSVDLHNRITREEQLISQNETVRSMLRGLAHEIRNPLGGLRGAAQLLQRELSEPGLREYTGVIIAEADRLQSLLDRMLLPRARPARRAMNIHEVTERVFALVTAEAPTGVDLVRDYDPSIPEIIGDCDQLVQALLNIARNAVQAVGEHGSIELKTRVLSNAAIGPDWFKLVAEVSVIDDGPGVPEALGNDVFYPMISGRPEGTGLGLAIAQSLVNQHEGIIECESTPGRTEFRILLPIDNATDRDESFGE
jgi:two-component system nitrogen regulation sensor histidine kinase GlnL